MPNSKHEDAFLKMGVEYFREHILKLLGINCEGIIQSAIKMVILKNWMIYPNGITIQFIVSFQRIIKQDINLSAHIYIIFIIIIVR